MSDFHPALIAALAGADRGPTEGVRVRPACGFAPSQPYLAEVTTMTPVGPLTVKSHGDTAEQAVDAARAQLLERTIEIAPADLRPQLRDPERIEHSVRQALLELLPGPSPEG